MAVARAPAAVEKRDFARSMCGSTRMDKWRHIGLNDRALAELSDHRDSAMHHVMFEPTERECVHP